MTFHFGQCDLKETIKMKEDQIKTFASEDLATKPSNSYLLNKSSVISSGIEANSCETQSDTSSEGENNPMLDILKLN
jgi:hypothetical protein